MPMITANNGILRYDLPQDKLPEGWSERVSTALGEEVTEIPIPPARATTRGSTSWLATRPRRPTWSRKRTRASTLMQSRHRGQPEGVAYTPDDIEGIYTLYPRCDGRQLTIDTTDGMNCFKSSLYIGAVRMLVYIFLPIIFLLGIQLVILSCMAHYHDEVKEELQNTADTAKKAAAKHQRRSVEIEKRAAKMQATLETQIATEDARVEERAQEMAAQMIQARMRGNMTRQKTASKLGKKASSIEQV
eukprot:TRINITY_DN1689_c0_g1_i1.p1 TRINITY_DN1689_c0_g1~~TRINITY_DN1689_c0_g1_i1.p1  ORF type:complete len:246 (-),score=14.90 TRINITY_DN1689_c0_g1_i1:174-911(-)